MNDNFSSTYISYPFRLFPKSNAHFCAQFNNKLHILTELSTLHPNFKAIPGPWICSTLDPAYLKGLSVFFPKCWSCSVEAGRCRWRWLTATTKGLFSQNCLTCKCQPFKVDPAASRYFCEQLASTLSDIPISHWLNISWRLFNDWLRISRYQISAHFTR